MNGWYRARRDSGAGAPIELGHRAAEGRSSRRRSSRRCDRTGGRRAASFGPLRWRLDSLACAHARAGHARQCPADDHRARVRSRDRDRRALCPALGVRAASFVVKAPPPLRAPGASGASAVLVACGRVITSVRSQIPCSGAWPNARRGWRGSSWAIEWGHRAARSSSGSGASSRGASNGGGRVGTHMRRAATPAPYRVAHRARSAASPFSSDNEY